MMDGLQSSGSFEPVLFSKPDDLVHQIGLNGSKHLITNDLHYSLSGVSDSSSDSI